MRYIPHTGDEVRRMLETIGAASCADLFKPLPAGIRLGRPLDLPVPLDEQGVAVEIGRLAARNRGAGMVPFVGLGSYRHYIPAAVGHLASRSEFLTAYTPYQPEMAQGTLQAIFEYQSMAARLTGMEIANASMYDGASGAAEALLMASRIVKRRKTFLVSRAVHPEYRETCRTYLGGTDFRLVELPFDPASGTTDPEALRAAIEAHASDLCAVMIQSPNFFGAIEPLARLFEIAKAAGAVCVAAFSEPVAFGLVEPPGPLGADIAAGEGQSLGIPMGFGGPGLGIFASRKRHARSMPGRLVGQTTDSRGRRSFVLTLNAREQHIRRERATSNICTNQGLCALTAGIHLALLGRCGLERLARRNAAVAHRLHDRLTSLPGLSRAFAGPFFNEFVVRLDDPAQLPGLRSGLQAAGLLAAPGLDRWYPDLPGCLPVCVTEVVPEEAIDTFAAVAAREVGR